MENSTEGFYISTDKSKIDVPFVHRFLTTAYWCKGISLLVVQRAIDGSLVFGVYNAQEQVGFARVITDGATFAYLADVFIAPPYRGKGLSKLLMKNILAHPMLQGLRRILLATRDAHGLYRQFSFEPLQNPDAWMQIHQPHIYNKEPAHTVQQ